MGFNDMLGHVPMHPSLQVSVRIARHLTLTTLGQEDVQNVFVTLVVLFYAQDAQSILCSLKWGLQFS